MGQCSTQPQHLDGGEIVPGNIDPECVNNEFGDMMKEQGMMNQLGEEIVYNGYQAEPVECVNAAAPETVDLGVMIGQEVLPQEVHQKRSGYMANSYNQTPTGYAEQNVTSDLGSRYAGGNPDHQMYTGGNQMYNPETDGKYFDSLEEAQAAMNGQTNCEKPAEVVYNPNQMYGHYTSQNPQPVPSNPAVYDGQLEPIVYDAQPVQPVYNNEQPQGYNPAAYNGQPVQPVYNNEQPQGYNQPREDQPVGHVPVNGYHAYDTPQPLFAPIENVQVMHNEMPVQEVTLEEQKPVTLEDGIEPEVDDAEQIQPNEDAYHSDGDEKNAEPKKKKKGSKKSWGWF